MLRLLFLLLSSPALAQAPPVPICLPQREGMTACFDGRLCVCRFQPGGALTGRPDGHRWDCGALRPDCRADAPTRVTPWPEFLPPPQILLAPGPEPRSLPPR